MKTINTFCSIWTFLGYKRAQGQRSEGHGLHSSNTFLLLLKGSRTFQKLSHLGGGVPTFLLERANKPGKTELTKKWWRYHFFITLQFSHIYCVCVRKVNFLHYFLAPQSFELAMEDSHSSLYSPKTLSFVYFWLFPEVYRKCWLLYLSWFEIHIKVHGKILLTIKARCLLILKKFWWR